MTVASPPSSDFELLIEHCAGSPEAFTELVHRHVDMVYSAALRQVRDAHLADDVTQAVFLLLWQKAASLRPDTILPGWLHRTTRYCAANAMRLGMIRQRHERRAASMKPDEISSALSTATENAELAAALDQAVAKLSPADREAVVLRFFAGKNADDIAAVLHVSPDAARKRIERAVVKLQKILSGLGVSTSAPSLISFLVNRCVVHSPPQIAASICTTLAVASAGSAVAGTGAAGIIAKGALVAMSAKSQWIAIAAVILLFIGGTSAVVAWNHKPPTAPTQPPQNIIRVQAYIDGRSRLCISGKSVHWSNLDYNPPGQFGKTRRPTIINGQNWYPTWTGLPLSTLSLSNSFDKLDPPLPRFPTTITINPVVARGRVWVVQQPAAANDYTLIVEFDDSGPAGAANYIVDISFPK